jgi:hypothetical protein
VLGFSLEHSLFDRLEEPRTAAAVAGDLGLEEGALGEVLAALVALGVLEERQGEYRNLELASRYLRVQSPESLHSVLLHQTGLATDWGRLAMYAKEGCPDFIPVADEEPYRRSCDALAKFTAPSVVERLDLGQRGPVMLAGWGGEAYREAVRRRWPGPSSPRGTPSWRMQRGRGRPPLERSSYRTARLSDRGEVQLMPRPPRRASRNGC